jgi:hypothetical protein
VFTFFVSVRYWRKVPAIVWTGRSPKPTNDCENALMHQALTVNYIVWWATRKSTKYWKQFTVCSFGQTFQFIVLTDKVTVTKLHLSWSDTLNLDKLINRRIKLVKRRILTTPAAKDYLEVHRRWSCLYTKLTNEFRIESIFEMRLHPPKCVDEVCRSHATIRTRGGDGNYARNFEFGANLPLADSFVIWMN